MRLALFIVATAALLLALLSALVLGQLDVLVVLDPELPGSTVCLKVVQPDNDTVVFVVEGIVATIETAHDSFAQVVPPWIDGIGAVSAPNATVCCTFVSGRGGVAAYTIELSVASGGTPLPAFVTSPAITAGASCSLGREVSPETWTCEDARALSPAMRIAFGGCAALAFGVAAAALLYAGMLR